MKNILFIAFISLTLINCDNNKSTSKKLTGEWEINSYKLTDTDNLNEYSDCSGSMIFDKSDDYTIPGTYSLNINYTFPSSNGSTIQSGTYEIIDKGGYMNITTIDTLNTITSTIRYRILTQTSTDLQLEFIDTIGQMHTYIFNKKK